MTTRRSFLSLLAGLVLAPRVGERPRTAVPMVRLTNCGFMTESHASGLVALMAADGFRHRRTTFTPNEPHGGVWTLVYRGTDRRGDAHEYLCLVRGFFFGFHRGVVRGLMGKGA